jgi:ribosomal protein S18 acetylase RimI-like enzyme
VQSSPLRVQDKKAMKTSLSTDPKKFISLTWIEERADHMAKDGYLIREMARNEVDLAISWAKDEGWNPGIHDAETFYRTDPHGFYVGILDDRPVSCISAVAYGDSFGFLGFYIVQPAFRGRGLGIKIWNAGMKHLEGRNIGLDGVLEQQKLYERIGFRQCYRRASI